MQLGMMDLFVAFLIFLVVVSLLSFSLFAISLWLFDRQASKHD